MPHLGSCDGQAPRALPVLGAAAPRNAYHDAACGRYFGRCERARGAGACAVAFAADGAV